MKLYRYLALAKSTNTAAAALHASASHYKLHRISAMRSAAFPSHRGGLTPVLPFPSKTCFSSAVNLFLSSPTGMFVPNVTIKGCSKVFGPQVQTTPDKHVTP